MARRPKCTVVPGLDAKLAQLVARPKVNEVARQVQAQAKRNAPPVKVWNTQRDARVRPTHVEADYQARPANLRFQLRNHPWDLGIGREPDSEWKPRATGPFAYFDRPREQVYGAYLNFVHCRCYLTYDKTGLSRLIRRDPAVALGAKVTASVWIRAPLVLEAERGDVYPGGYIAEGTWFMRKAAYQVAARNRSTGR